VSDSIRTKRRCLTDAAQPAAAVLQ
jgi:hypothetical protein